MVSPTLDVQRRQVLSESVRRVIGEQVRRNLVGKEAVKLLHVVADHPEHQHVRAEAGRFVQHVRIEELLFANDKVIDVSWTFLPRVMRSLVSACPFSVFTLHSVPKRPRFYFLINSARK